MRRLRTLKETTSSTRGSHSVHFASSLSLVLTVAPGASHYHSIYKISGRTGEVLWTLGGKNSTFAVDDGAEFSWQHHARWIEEGAVLSIFDNDSGSSIRAVPFLRCSCQDGR